MMHVGAVAACGAINSTNAGITRLFRSVGLPDSTIRLRWLNSKPSTRDTWFEEAGQLGGGGEAAGAEVLDDLEEAVGTTH